VNGIDYHDTQRDYFGWDTFEHGDGCARPVWEVQHRVDQRVRPDTHECVVEGCDGHLREYSVVSVRMVCRSCEVAHVVRGEGYDVATTTTAKLGYGCAPVKAHGLYLYASRPLLYALDPGPAGYLVTARKVTTPDPGDVVGIIGQSRGPRGGMQWWAGADMTIEPAFVTDYYSRGYPRVHAEQKQDGFRSQRSAARWIANLIHNATSEGVSTLGEPSAEPAAGVVPQIVSDADSTGRTGSAE